MIWLKNVLCDKGDNLIPTTTCLLWNRNVFIMKQGICILEIVTLFSLYSGLIFQLHNTIFPGSFYYNLWCLCVGGWERLHRNTSTILEQKWWKSGWQLRFVLPIILVFLGIGNTQQAAIHCTTTSRHHGVRIGMFDRSPKLATDRKQIDRQHCL